LLLREKIWKIDFMEIVAREIDRYIEGLYSESDPVLQEMERYGHARNFPLVGPQVGRVLFMFTKLLGAKRIFEMGSGFGYSAYWFAKALARGGKVYQTETSDENSKLAQEFFKKSGLGGKSEFLVGDGTQWIDKIGGEFDIIFMDMNKYQYPAGFQKAKARLKKGGLLLADNVLWFGQVLEESDDPDTLGIKEFTRLLFHDPDFFATILPIRDGVGVGYRL
jgi:predicted O-methyltransferase YrrM